jgi:hypothetical protein
MNLGAFVYLLISRQVYGIPEVCGRSNVCCVIEEDNG